MVTADVTNLNLLPLLPMSAQEPPFNRFLWMCEGVGSNLFSILLQFDLFV